MTTNETHKEKMMRKKMERASNTKKARKTVVKLSDVKTPTTVDEFRENLSRFFVKDGGINNLMVIYAMAANLLTVLYVFSFHFYL